MADLECKECGEGISILFKLALKNSEEYEYYCPICLADIIIETPEVVQEITPVEAI